MTNSLEDVAKADAILLTGTNTTENHPVIAQMIKTAVLSGGTKLVVVDPRDIPMARHADIYLRPRPGTDVAWLNGMARVVIKEGLADEEFIRARTENFEELERAVEPYTPEMVGKITGIKPADLKKAARLYATADNAAIYYAMGITQHTTGTDTVKAIANLAMLTGNVGRPGTGVNPLRGQNNVKGACDMGALPDVLQGYRQVSDEKARASFEKAWGRRLPEHPGMTVLEMMRAAERGDIRAMYIVGENPVLTDPDSSHVQSALRNLDLLVVEDIFMTETAELADVVLPGAASLEKQGTFTNTERRVQLTRPAVAPPGQARTDMEILVELARRMGYEQHYGSPADVMDEIASLTPSYAGISHRRLAKRGLRWPCPDVKHPGTRILHAQQFTRGRGRFHPVEYIEPAEMPDREFPFVLTTGRMLYHFHTGSMSRRSKALADYLDKGWAEVNQRDARRLGLAEGSPIRLTSRRGTVETVARLTRRSPEGVIFMSFHFAEEAVNELTNAAMDPEGKIPELKVCAVKVEATVTAAGGTDG